jgi:hypothetical protein
MTLDTEQLIQILRGELENAVRTGDTEWAKRLTKLLSLLLA